jgi:thiamine biosynthesis lipoprotein
MDTADGVVGASWRALGTGAQVLVTDGAALDPARDAVETVLSRVDAAYSRFRPDSELSALNAAGGRRVRVSPLLFDAIEVALRAARATGGAVDPTIGHAIRLLGYDRDFATLPADAPAPLLIERVPGWQAVVVDQTARTVRLPAHVELDLGSTGKSYAADLAASAASAIVGPGVGILVNLGGDIATAGPAPDGGWRITCTDDAATDPATPGPADDVVAIQGGAVATSSTTVRRWTSGGIVRQHIVDPATLLPVDGPWRTATVVAATCADANAAATAAIVLGERAPDWLTERGLAARLVGHDSSILRVAGWPSPLENAA